MTTLVSRFLHYVHKALPVFQERLQMENALPAQSDLQERVTSSAQTALKQQPEDPSILKRTISDVSISGMDDLFEQAAKVRKDDSGTQPLQTGLQGTVLQQGGMLEQISKVQSAVGIVPPPAENKVTPTLCPSEQVIQAQKIEGAQQQQATIEKIKCELITKLIRCNHNVIRGLSNFSFFIHYSRLFKDEELLEKEVIGATKDNLAAVLNKVKQTLSSWGNYTINERAKTSLVDALDWIDECLRSIESSS